MFRGPYSYISNNQDAQSGGTKFNPQQAKYMYSDLDVFPTLLHDIVFQSGGEIPPR